VSVISQAGVTPGVHFGEARFYIRRVRLGYNSPLIKPLQKCGYKIEPTVDSPNDTVVVEIPIDAGKGMRTAKEVSMWEQLEIAKFMQRHWADNQVSATVTFDPITEGHHLEAALNYAQYSLKGVSFLPRSEKKAYPQMPYEEITEAEYRSMMLKILVFDSTQLEIKGQKATGERGCNNDTCTPLL
jgi:ribonucleoside-triphosphate reductase